MSNYIYSSNIRRADFATVSHKTIAKYADRIGAKFIAAEPPWPAKKLYKYYRRAPELEYWGLFAYLEHFVRNGKPGDNFAYISNKNVVLPSAPDIFKEIESDYIYAVTDYKSSLRRDTASLAFKIFRHVTQIDTESIRFEVFCCNYRTAKEIVHFARSYKIPFRFIGTFSRRDLEKATKMFLSYVGSKLECVKELSTQYNYPVAYLDKSFRDIKEPGIVNLGDEDRLTSAKKLYNKYWEPEK